MNLGTVADSLPTRKAAVYCLVGGREVRHDFAGLAGAVDRAVENLKRWGVKAGTRVGIYAPNSQHWLIHDLALIRLGVVSVPFTSDFAGKIDRELLDKYQISLLLIAKDSTPAPARAPYIAYMDSENEDVAAIPRAVNEEDAGLLTMAFSSGSAGGLKGLAISREGVEATLPPIYEAIGLQKDDRLLIFMPMSNFQQRTMCYGAIWYDFDIILTDHIQVMACMNRLSPTLLVAPPVFFQGVYTRFMNLPPAKKTAWTLLSGLLGCIPVASWRRALAERLFRELHKQFGGRMRVMVTGMAPIKRDVAAFFSRMQLPLCESYGLVETGSLTFRPPDSNKFGSVGKPVEGVKFEFTDDGEIIVNRKKSMTRNYFQSAPGENERTFIAPGRIATGDIGRLDQDGYLYLLGRKKELIITAGGYKIHPEIVESELNGCQDIAQAAVFLKPGSATLSCVVALNNAGDEDAKARVRAFARNMQATKASQIGDVFFAEGVFSIENGMLRPNLKLDRRAIAARYNLS